MLFLKVSPESVLALAFENQTKPASVHAAKGIRRRKDLSGFFCKTAFYFSFKTLLVVFVFWLWRLQFVTKVTNASIIEMGFELEKKRKEKMVAAFF